MVVVTVFYIGLSFSHPDYFIAKYNISQMLSNPDTHHDTIYLAFLSADAAPAILDEETLIRLTDISEDKNAYSALHQTRYAGDSWMDEYATRISFHNQRIEMEGTKIRAFNLSRFIAGKYIARFLN